MSNRVLTVCIVLFFCFADVAASVEQYTPQDDTNIVAVSYASAAKKTIGDFAVKKADYLQPVHDVSTASELAGAYLHLARSSNDPRYYGLAEKVLEPWWNDSQHEELLYYKALILEFNHQFDESNALLNKILKGTPQSAQALMLRANNYMAQGKLVFAMKDCRSLIGVTSNVLVSACIASAKSSQVNQLDALNMALQLQRLLKLDTSLDRLDQQWVAGIVLETLLIHDYFDKAKQFFYQSLAINNVNEYMLTLYVDNLLDMGFNSEVLALVSGNDLSAGLLTRLTIAMKKLKHPEFHDFEKRLLQQFNAESMRAQVTHFKERALYQLLINENPQVALVFAKRNWEQQRELADAKLLIECAMRSNDHNTLLEIDQWKAENQIAISLSKTMKNI